MTAPLPPSRFPPVKGRVLYDSHDAIAAWRARWPAATLAILDNVEPRYRHSVSITLHFFERTVTREDYFRSSLADFLRDAERLDYPKAAVELVVDAANAARPRVHAATLRRQAEAAGEPDAAAGGKKRGRRS